MKCFDHLSSIFEHDLVRKTVSDVRSPYVSSINRGSTCRGEDLKSQPLSLLGCQQLSWVIRGECLVVSDILETIGTSSDCLHGSHPPDLWPEFNEIGSQNGILPTRSCLKIELRWSKHFKFFPTAQEIPTLEGFAPSMVPGVRSSAPPGNSLKRDHRNK